MKISSQAEEAINLLNIHFSSADNKSVKKEDIEKKFEELKGPLGWNTITEDERNYIIRKIISLIGIQKDNDECLINQDEYKTHCNTWFTDLDSENRNWFRQYRAQLIQKGWSENIVKGIDKSSDDIMNYLGNPKEESFSIRGLIMGDIQSGKTANFIALCNKAADAGYRLIIVTTGIIEKLRKQTQSRLEKEFVKIVPNLTIPTLTNINADFNKTQVKNPISVFVKDRPVLCVVKKNVTILHNLLEWLSGKEGKVKKSTQEQNDKLQWPLLFIDDEADNASVNTNDLSDEENPTRTNEFIRRILNLFEKSSYVGVTATPFANVFIDPETDEAALAGDLFPRSFVYRLTPPSNYFGANILFQDGSPYLKELNDIEGWLKAKHKKDDYPTEDFPQTLRYAIGYFMLSNGVMDYLEKNNETIKHRTMMIHISRFISIQNRIATYIESYVKKLVGKIANYCGDAEKAEKIDELKFLHKIWNQENLSLRCDKISWATFLKNYLRNAVCEISVVSINSQSSKNTLDYEEGPKRVIVVGGNALSRGLTLEGLFVSYFRRTTMMCDTLLQMARWCGYRNQYKELVRVWMPLSQVDNFGYASEISDDLSEMFHQMVETRCSPKDFAIKIRKNPGAMMPTARNKMRTASVATIPVSLAGYAVETPRMLNNKEIIEINNKKIINFLSENKSYISDSGGWVNKSYLRNIPIGKIKQLLSDFKVGLMSYGFNMNEIIQYMDKYYNSIDILISTTDSIGPDSLQIGDNNNKSFLLRKAKRHLSLAPGNDIIQINGTKLKVTSGGEMKHIFTREQAMKIAQDYTESSRKRKKTTNISSVPDYFYLQHAPHNTNPLIAIQYVCSSNQEQIEGIASSDFFAMSIGFPGERGESSEVFYLTKTATEEYFNSEMEE